MVKRLLLIVNPMAGMKTSAKNLQNIICLFSNYGYLSTVFITQKRGDGVTAAREYSDDFDIVVCIGGDGTFNEVITGIMQSNSKTPLGYIAAGSTNDFATSMHLSKNIMTAAKDIMEGKPKTFDIGKFNDSYFSYVASFGAFTKTSYTTPQNVKNALGHIAYILEGMKDLPFITPEHLRIEANGISYEEDYIFGAISNSTSIGGILSLDENVVDMNDGLFEMLLIKSPNSALEITNIISALSSGQFESTDSIKFITASSMSIYSPELTNWSLDGEFQNGSEEVEVKNIKDAVQIIVNDKKSRI